MLRKSRSVWNVRAIPRRGDLVRRQPDQRAVVEQDVPLVGLVDAGDEVEQRRLARAVRADHAHDLALVHVQVELVDHAQAAERHRDALELEDARPLGRCLGHQISTRGVPSKPCGRAIISTISSAPSSRMRVTLGSDDEPVLPHARRKVERRDGQQRPPQPAQLRQRDHGRDQEHEADVAEACRIRRVDHPALQQRRQASTLDRAGHPLGPQPIGELVGDDAEDDRAAKDDPDRPPRPHEANERDEDRAVEEPARVARDRGGARATR